MTIHTRDDTIKRDDIDLPLRRKKAATFVVKGHPSCHTSSRSKEKVSATDASAPILAEFQKSLFGEV